MIVGHFIIKRYRKFKDQGIGTRFIIVGIPLIPIQSFYYLDSKRSIDIDLHWQHALKAVSYTHLDVYKRQLILLLVLLLVLA